MVRAIIIGLALIVTMAVFQETQAKVCTRCLSGGYCPCSHPQCCIVSGRKRCCRFRFSQLTDELNTDTETISGKIFGDDDDDDENDNAPRFNLSLPTIEPPKKI